MEPLDAFRWPPITERTIAMDAFTIVCPDKRTSMVMTARAFDLSDEGYDIPYYRREMVILDRVSRRQGIATTEIIGLSTKEEAEQIHPALSPIMIDCLNEELTLMSYLEIKDGKAFVTDKGIKKVEDFKAGLPVEVREALRV